MLATSIASIDLDAKSRRPAKVKSVKVVSRTTSSVTLKWKKAKRAKKYQIRYKKIGAKKYKKAITKKRRIKIKNLKSNTKYVFRVRGKNKKYGKFSKKIVVKTKEKSGTNSNNNQENKYPKGFVPNPKVTVNGKTVTIGDSIDSVNRKFKLEKAGLYDTGKYPWNIYEPYTDNFLMVRVKNNKVYGFYTSSRKFTCKSGFKSIKFGDSYEKAQQFINHKDTDVSIIQYHTIKKTVDDVYYDRDEGEDVGRPNVSYKKQIAGAETIAEYTFNQLRYNEGRSVLDTSQKTTAGKVCKACSNEWLTVKSGKDHWSQRARLKFIAEKFPNFEQATPLQVAMAASCTTNMLGIECGTVYATGTSVPHYANVMETTDITYGVLSISIGKDPGGEYEMHSTAHYF